MRNLVGVLVLTLACAFIPAPLAAEAQQGGKVWRIGCLWSPAAVPVDIEAFRQGLRDLGYREGRDLLIEWRFADGMADRLPRFWRSS
jgi:putative tryptophan/tyrosine transport system substrate-binding protein